MREIRTTIWGNEPEWRGDDQSIPSPAGRRRAVSRRSFACYPRCSVLRMKSPETGGCAGHAYVNNAPTRFIDPLGLKPQPLSPGSPEAVRRAQTRQDANTQTGTQEPPDCGGPVGQQPRRSGPGRPPGRGQSQLSWPKLGPVAEIGIVVLEAPGVANAWTVASNRRKQGP